MHAIPVGHEKILRGNMRSIENARDPQPMTQDGDSDNDLLEENDY